MTEETLQEVRVRSEMALIELNHAMMALDDDDYELRDRLRKARGSTKQLWNYAQDLKLEDMTPRSPHQLRLIDWQSPPTPFTRTITVKKDVA